MPSSQEARLAAQEVLKEAVQDVALLPDVAEHLLYDAETAAWDKLYRAIKAARADPTVLKGYTAEPMRAVLAFLVSWLFKKKTLKNRILECMAILLGDSAWMRTTKLPPMQLRDQLLGVFASDEALRQQLLADEPAELEVVPERPSLDLLSRCNAETHDMKNNLCAGAHVMQEFQWEFPSSSPTDSDRDAATAGFQAFHKGVTRLKVVAEQLARQSAIEEYTASVTEDLAQFWPDILRFLRSMHMADPVRERQIQFVKNTLSAYLPKFRAVAQWRKPGIECSKSSGYGTTHGGVASAKCVEDIIVAVPAPAAAEPELGSSKCVEDIIVAVPAPAEAEPEPESDLDDAATKQALSKCLNDMMTLAENVSQEHLHMCPIRFQGLLTKLKSSVVWNKESHTITERQEKIRHLNSYLAHLQ